MSSPTNSQTGAVSVIIALILVSLITASVVVLGGALSRQIRASQDIVSAERAFYAAYSGYEHALYVRCVNQQDVSSDNPITDDISYDDESASYSAYVSLIGDNDISAISTGIFRNLKRGFGNNDENCTL